MNKTLNQLKANPYWVIILLWIVAEAFYVFKFGVNFQLEAAKYINEAIFFIQNHHFSQARYFFYSSTIFIIIFSKLCGAGVYGALILISAINLFSYLYFYKALQYYSSNKNIALIICIILITFWPFQIWSIYLYTENIFYSSVIILFSRLLLFKEINFRFLFSISGIVAWVIISRPLGILFLIPVLLFIYFNLTKKQKIVFFIGGAFSLICIYFVIQTVFTTTSDWSMKRSLVDQSIICDIPENTNDSNIDLSNNPSQLYQLLYYITHNFSLAFKLAIIRLRYFFFLIRNYYSAFHNAYLLIYLTSIYLIIFIKFKKIMVAFTKPIKLFIASSIFLFAITVALQCDDYHNRFFLTLFPMFVTLAVVAVKYKNIAKVN